MHNPFTAPTPLRRLACASLFAFAGASCLKAQGQAEDEWYDPTDWFDGNNIEADDTPAYGLYDYDYDYGFDGVYDYGDNWASYDTWDGDYYEYDSAYWDDIDWYENDDLIDDDLTETYTYTIYANPPDVTSGEQSQQQAQQGQLAQNQSQQQNRQSQQEQTAQQRSASQAGNQVAQLTGTIEGINRLNLQRASGATGQFVVAKVKLDNGRTTIVNLGRDSQLEDLDLKKGDQIQVLGRRGQIADESIFVAHKLKAKGETIDANPAIRLTAQTSQSKRAGSQSSNQSGEQPQQTIKGTVASVSKASSESQQGHTLINLQLESGQSAVVDLGPAASLEKIDLQEGESVTIRGQSKQMNGRQVIVPQLLRVDGERVALTE